MSTLKVFYYFCKILGICPLNISTKGCVRLSYSGLVYSAILAVTYGAFYMRATANETTQVLPQRTPVTELSNFVALTSDVAALMTAWLYFGVRPQQLQRILVRAKSVNRAFRAHGICPDAKMFFRQIKIHLTTLNVFWHLLNIYYCVLIHVMDPSKLSILMPLTFPRIVNHNIAIIFVDIMKSCGRQFNSLNEKIRSLSNDGSMHNLRRPTIRKHIRKNSGLEWSTSTNPIEACGQIYSDLFDLTTMVVKFFSVAILFTIVFEFIQIASSTYIICLIIMDGRLKKWTFAWVSWFSIHLGEMVVIICACDSTANEANNTGNALHTTMIAKQMQKYEGSAKVLSLGLLQHRFEVKIFGLFSLKHSTIHRIFSTITGYVTIMIQLDSLNYPE